MSRIELGKANGLDLCRTLLTINPRTNVVYSTAYMNILLTRGVLEPAVSHLSRLLWKENNAPGFVPVDDDREPYIALANIKQRLKIMCGGKLTIRPREGDGTVVIVIII